MNQATASSRRPHVQYRSAMKKAGRHVGLDRRAVENDIDQIINDPMKDDEHAPSSSDGSAIGLKRKTGAGRHPAEPRERGLQHISEQQDRADQIQSRRGVVPDVDGFQHGSLLDIDASVVDGLRPSKNRNNDKNANRSPSTSLEDLFDLFVWNAQEDEGVVDDSIFGGTASSDTQSCPHSPVRVLPFSSILQHPSSAPGGGICTPRYKSKYVRVRDRASICSASLSENSNNDNNKEERKKALDAGKTTTTTAGEKLRRRRVEDPLEHKPKNNTTSARKKKDLHSPPPAQPRTTDRLSLSTPTPRSTIRLLVAQNELQEHTEHHRRSHSLSSPRQKRAPMATNYGRNSSIHIGTPPPNGISTPLRHDTTQRRHGRKHGSTEDGASCSQLKSRHKVVTFADQPEIFVPTTTTTTSSCHHHTLKSKKDRRLKHHHTVRAFGTEAHNE